MARRGGCNQRILSPARTGRRQEARRDHGNQRHRCIWGDHIKHGAFPHRARYNLQSHIGHAQPNVQLPLPVESKQGEIYTPELLRQINEIFRDKLLLEWKTFATYYFHNGAWWCRCCAQVFNDVRLSLCPVVPLCVEPGC